MKNNGDMGQILMFCTFSYWVIEMCKSHLNLFREKMSKKVFPAPLHSAVYPFARLTGEKRCTSVDA